MAGVLPDDIYNLRTEPCTANVACTQKVAESVSGPDVDSNMYSLSRDVPRKPDRADERLLITYTVKFRSASAPYKVYSQLLSATVGSVFGNNLQSFANENDATELYNVVPGVANVLDTKMASHASYRYLRAESFTSRNYGTDFPLFELVSHFWTTLTATWLR